MKQMLSNEMFPNFVWTIEEFLVCILYVVTSVVIVFLCTSFLKDFSALWLLFPAILNDYLELCLCFLNMLNLLQNNAFVIGGGVVNKTILSQFLLIWMTTDKWTWLGRMKWMSKCNKLIFPLTFFTPYISF